MSDTDFGEILDEWGAGIGDGEPTSTIDAEAPDIEESTASSATDDSTQDSESGQPRDDKGRFAGKATDSAAAETQPTAEKTAPVAPTAQPDAAQAQPQEQESPFAFRSLGQEVPIEGAVRRADGSLVVPAASLPTVQQLLARGHEFQTRGMAQQAQLQNELKQLKEQSSQPTLNERKYEAAYKHVAAALDDQNLLARMATDPEYAALYLERLHNIVERVGIEHERTQRERVSRVDETSQRDSLETQAVSGSLEQIVGMHAELTAEDKQHLGEWVQENRAALIREATPEDAMQWGVQVGERVIDNTRIMKHAQYIANLRKQSNTQATKVQEAARFNKAQQPKAPAPPAKKTASATVATPAAKAKTGKQEFDEVFKNWSKRPDLSFADDDED